MNKIVGMSVSFGLAEFLLGEISAKNCAIQILIRTGKPASGDVAKINWNQQSPNT